ncbi:MAG: type II toxin-antitoxin system VapC family toxin [Bryobacteraceae bacterium]
MRFWDSSAVVPLLVRQEASERMMRLFSEDGAVTVRWGTRVECDSAIVRLERDGFLSAGAVQKAFGRLDDLAALWHEIQPVDILRETARRILRLHNLRAADALQLAAAHLAAEQRCSTLEVVCRDERRARSAARGGVVVVNG